MAVMKSLSHMTLPMCPVKLACDGATIRDGRAMCSKCAERMARKAKEKAPVKLKGEKPTQPSKRGRKPRTQSGA